MAVNFEEEVPRPDIMRPKSGNIDRNARPASRRSAYNEDPDNPGRPLHVSEPSFFTQFSLVAYMKGRTVSCLAWSCFILALITFLMMLVVFAAPGWGYTLEIRGTDHREGYMYGYYGLWYACWMLDPDMAYWDVHTDCELMTDLKNVPGWFAVVQVFGTFVLLGTFFSLVATGVYVFSRRFNKNNKLITVALILPFSSALCSVVGFVVFCVQFLHDARWCCSGSVQILEWHLHYCFVLACIITVFFWTSSITCYLEKRSLLQGVKRDQYLQRVASTRKAGFYGPGYGPPVQIQNYGPNGYNPAYAY